MRRTYARLADQCGMTLREFLERHDSREIAERVAIARIDKTQGERMERLELLVGHLCVIMVNAHKSKSGKAAKLEDFIPDLDRPEQTSEEQMALLGFG
jgi:hypothetical protein